jgi:16S rRNA (cytosine1402-N4)-methyltransferase
MRTRRSQSSGNPVSPTPNSHVPVLLHEVIEFLNIQADDVVVDATLGGAGHARALADKLGEKGVFIGFDLDADALERAHESLKGAKPTVHLVNANFRTLSAQLETLGIQKITKILFDLGWSSYQLNSGRGLSFLRNEQLIMTFRKNPGPSELTAATIVNEWAEESLADVIYGWGEERYSRRIAKAIVERRAWKRIETSTDLAEIVRDAVPPAYRRGRLHPATKTFQALRIAVNDELGALSEGLRSAFQRLAPGGRVAVISFHSIEDRIVKQTFVQLEKEGQGIRLTKKPIAPSIDEIQNNPRSRSAKLRVLEKTNEISI